MTLRRRCALIQRQWYDVGLTRAAWKTNLACALWPASFTVLANAPGRYAMAARDHQFGFGLTASLVLGLLADLACLGPVLALALAPSEWIAAQRSGHRSSRAALATAVVTIALLSLVMWVVSVAATEFRIQRGTYPALVETRDGLADAEFLRGSAKIALFGRYSWPTVFALFAWVGVLVAYTRSYLRRRRPSDAALRTALGTAFGSLAWGTLAAGLILLVRAIAPTATSDAWIPPLVRLGADAGATRDVAGHGGARRVLASFDFGDATVRSGLHALGFGDDQARCLARDPRASCGPHPLARPLPGDGTQWIAPDIPNEPPTALVQGFLALSAALFDDHQKPLTVWHIALESFRADDVHALHGAAPAETTPFINSAYAGARPDGARSIAFRHAFQSGLRTAQAVSGLWCGLGAMPFQLAMSRDLTDLSLRCMPDVLRDAGFDTRLYYGANASFENLGQFAAGHGLAVTDVSTLPAGLLRGAFRAVTDAALFGAAHRDAAEVGPLAYRFVLTLSGHSPFDVPEDVSPMTQSRAGNAIPEHPYALFSPEDRRRLLTMAYADEAVAAFVHAIEGSSLAARSIFLISADHATADPFLWERPTGESLARVPLIVYLPAALVGSSKDPERVEQEVHSLSILAGDLPVSLNDVPSLLLALLARHAALKHLPPERRWHTLGGATSSHHFKVRETTTAQVWGIDAASRVFMVQRDAVDQLFDTGERSVAFSIWDEPLGPLLKDVTGALSAVLRVCSGPNVSRAEHGMRCMPSLQ